MTGPNTLGNKGFVPQAFTTMTPNTVDFTYHNLHGGIRWGLVTILDKEVASEVVSARSGELVASLEDVEPAGQTSGIRSAAAPIPPAWNHAIATPSAIPVPPGGSAPAYPVSLGGGMITPGVPVSLNGGYGLGITGALASASSSSIELFVVPGTGEGGSNTTESMMSVPLPTGVIFLVSALIGVTGAGRMRKPN
jgi:hypothetical protein